MYSLYLNTTRTRNGAQRGVALVSTLLLLSLMAVLTIAMVLAVSSDTLINGYYRNSRTSFYAADSGLNIARQQMLNAIVAAVPATFPAGTPPIPAGVEASIQSSILGTYGSGTPLNQGSASKSWSGTYRLTRATLALVVPSAAPAGCPLPVIYTGCTKDSTGKITGYSYLYNYELEAEGQSLSSEQTRIVDQGSFVLNASLAPAGPVNTSFAAWGMFIDRYTACSGSYLVPGLISGPVHTNGAWTFGTTGSYIFTDQVTTVSAVSGFQFSGTCGCKTSSLDALKCGSSTIAPTFQGGYNKGQPAVPLPTNDFNQRRAVLDGMGAGGTNPTPAEMNATLRNASGAKYPASGTTSGVWLPYSVTTDPITGATVNTFTGGGIYVEGSASVVLDGQAANGSQVYTITQSGVTTTVTVDPANNRTTIRVGTGTPTDIVGVPNQIDPSTGGVVRDATMLYVNGSITSLRGPGQGLAGVNDGQAITITAATNVTITGDVIYKTAPVTKTQNQIPGTPPATLIPGADNGQVLGIFTATGDIQMINQQSSGNLEIDASLATISQSGSGGLINTGSRINTLTIIGGRIQNNIKNINSTTRNVLFDRRFAGGQFGPPWFPSTTVTPGGVASANLASSVQRVRWAHTSAF